MYNTKDIYVLKHLKKLKHGNNTLKSPTSKK